MQFYLVSKLFFYLEELCDSEGLWKFIDKYGIPFSVWVWTKISNSNDESQFNFNLLLSPINKFYFWSNNIYPQILFDQKIVFFKFLNSMIRIWIVLLVVEIHLSLLRESCFLLAFFWNPEIASTSNLVKK